MNTVEDLKAQIPFAPHASAKYVWEELLNRGWSIKVLRAEAEKLYVLTIAEKDGVSFLLSEVQHLLYTPLNDRQSYFLTANKSRTQSILEAAGLRYPRNIFEVQEDTVSQLNGFNVEQTLVVKPHASHGGKGVTIINSTEALSPAVQNALEQSDTAIVQEFAQGNEHRLLCIDGQFVAAFRCRPACVQGDSKNTVRELIELKNAKKSDPNYKGTRSKIKIDRAEAFMGEKGLDWVPEIDELVVLDSISNISFGGDAIDATDAVNSELKERVGALCKLTSLGVVGIDIISTDISSSDVNAHMVTEINGSPGLRPHLLIEEGTSRNVAIPYVDALEKYAQMRYNRTRKALI